MYPPSPEGLAGSPSPMGGDERRGAAFALLEQFLGLAERAVEHGGLLAFLGER